MLECVEGVFRNGRVELLEKPETSGESRVLVTFLGKSPNGSGGPQMSNAELIESRSKLAAWEEDWNAPGMEAYDRS